MVRCHKLLLISVMLLVIGYGEGRVCVGLRELTFHTTPKKNFAYADNHCNGLGGRLVKEDNAEITKAITGAIQSNAYYYIGAKRITDGGPFFWRDNSKVPFPRESGYSNWKDGEPNDENQESCVIIRNTNWRDDSCTVARFFICQKEFGVTASLTSGTIRVASTQKYSTTCTATASECVTPTVTWYRNRITVSKETSRNVYQSGGSGSATLWLQNLRISPDYSGLYECQAVANGKQSNWIGVTVTVAAGPPIISSLIAEPCTTNLKVSWKAHPLAKGFPHSVKVYPKSGPVSGQPMFFNENELYVVRHLLPSTLYTVEVIACITQSNCPTAYTTKRSLMTRGGRPNPATRLNLVHRGDECRLTWQKSSVVGDQPTGYEVKVTEKYVASRTNETGKSHVFNATGYLYTFVPHRNRDYSASVIALACGRASEPIQSSGSCIGSPQAPANVTSPTVAITAKGNLNVLVQVPSEEKGIISCLLVIISGKTRMGNETGNQTVFTLEQLSMVANTSARRMSDYVAVAIPASRFASKKEIPITVGDATTSSCDLYKTSLETDANSDKLNKSVIVGQNKPLNSSEQQWVYVVAAVPDRTRILFKRSAQVVFSRLGDRPYTTSPTDTNLNDASSTSPGKPEPNSTAATVGAICGVVILILLSVVSFVIYKRRKDPKRATSSNLSNARPSTNREGENPNVGWHQEDGDGVDIQDNRDGNYAYTNYAPGLHNETSFRFCDIEKVYDTKQSKNNAVFLDEFKKIVQDSAQIEGTKEVASSDHLKPKNRYKNILPYDANRVVLETGDSGYINASYIRGCSQTDKYIATQGPLAATVNDFWLMIFEQNSSIIVMLTKGCEAGKKKCESYWPGSQMHRTYGCVTVQNIQEINHGAYICRTFSISFAAGGDKAEARSVRHYQFLKWPDHGVPQTTSNLVRMHRDIAQDYAGSPSIGPMVVHCSAGAGRTGTFIGYDILADEMRIKSRIDVSKCVMDMRKQRVDMVQNSEQYVLLHKLVLESYLFDETDCSPEEAKNKFEEMNRPGGNAVVLKEFEDLDKVEPIKNTKNIGMLEENEAFNRPGNELPFDYSNVTIMMRESEERAPYLNASCVESYDDGYRMIAAQGLTDASIEVFWRAVVSNGVRTIVMLTNLVENNKEQCVQYWPSAPGEKLVLGDISVTLVSHEAHGTIVERNFSVEQATKRRALQVTQLHYIDWQQGSNPGNERDVIDLIVRMQEILRQTTKAAALIHCSDGTGRTGTFCAIVNLIDRLKCENRIDVFRTVKDLRDGRPNMVKTLDQYKYCYQAIVHYLKSFELYANF